MPVLLIFLYSLTKYWVNIYHVTVDCSACKEANRKQREAPSGDREANNEVCADRILF